MPIGNVNFLCVYTINEEDIIQRYQLQLTEFQPPN